MAYGFEIRNALGENVLDGNAALYLQSSGQTSSAVDLGLFQDFSGAFAARFPRNDHMFHLSPPTASFASWVNHWPRFIGTGSAFIEGAAVTVMRAPTPLRPRTAMAFYQPGPGLTMSTEQYIGPRLSVDATPAQGLYFCTHADGDGPLNYLIADTQVSEAMAGNYGLQIRDANGVVTFDSRADLFSIFETINVPSATISDILFNGASVDYTLSAPLPGCYISCPYFAAFRLRALGGGQSQYERVRIRQIDNVTLRLDHVTHGPSFISSRSGSYVQDLFIFIARNPFA